MKRHSGYVFALLTLLASPAFAHSLTAQRLAEDIGTKGPRAAVLALDGAGQMDEVLNGISSGNAAWIRLAPALAKGTDAGDSTGLSVALAHALPRNARAVLAVLDDGPVTGAAVVCSVPFIEPTPQEVRDYLKRAVPAVRSVSESAHLPRRGLCLRTLEQITVPAQNPSR